MFKDGKATYCNQFVPSPRFQIEQELGEEFFQNIGEFVGWIGLIKALIGKLLVREKLDDEMKVHNISCYMSLLLLTAHIVSHLFVAINISVSSS